MKESKPKSELGFTLTELLIVVAITGTLAGIAIPQFSSYRKRAYETQVKGDLKNAATAEEAYFTTSLVYKGGDLSETTLPGFNKSEDVTVSATVGTNTFVISASHVGCGGATWTFNNTTGQIVGPPGGCL
jgi:type IV pilus assembly protein PilA